MDDRLRAQLPKVEVVADPAIEAVFPRLQRVVVTITTTDGRSFDAQLDYPKGDPRNPLTDAEVEAKFDALAEPVLDAAGAPAAEGRRVEPRASWRRRAT